MDQNLRVLFERALGDEPMPPPGNLAQEAMVRGTALRRRRGLLTGGATGVVAVIATMVALSTAPTGGTAPLVVTPGALIPPGSTICAAPAHREATHVRVFLRLEITDEQRLDLRGDLQSDPLVRSVTFESREQAYDRFRKMFKDDPDLIEAVTVDQLPESFHVKLTNPAEYLTFVAKFDGTDGVDLILGSMCPAGARSGEDG